MRKSLLSLLAASAMGLAGLGAHPANATPRGFEPSPLAQPVQYRGGEGGAGDNWRGGEWRRRERYGHAYRHERQERWHRRGYDDRGW